ncbi:MAG: EAL domain-containing protein [Ilumatobacter sp.]|uniref:putative bifunctional diguanylate cyclase/phosphodiesterase n=1 Tax=Ilumatobacter sp. TaxID=1967498 RepID=UPI00261E01EA|nr:EAL domain-containing protein [Ilumatobacter sp.]MDJ0768069.1 EAL domain-containing protein [Ilumatobacter sp.]
MTLAIDADLARVAEGRRLPGYGGVVGVDDGGVIRYVSADLDGRFGLRIDDVIGRSFLEFIEDFDAEQAVESFGGVLQRPGHHQVLEVALRSADGSVPVDVVADNCLEAIGLVLLNLGDPLDRRRSVQLLHAQAEAIRKIALGGSLNAAVNEILVFLERALPGFRAAAFLEEHLWAGEATASPSLPPTFTDRMALLIRDDAHHPGALAVNEDEVIIAADVGEPRWATSVAAMNDAGERFGCIWSVPIRHARGEDSRGCIEVYGPHVAHPHDEDWTILELASRLAAVAFDRNRMQAQLVRDAEIDPLTGTPNRRVLKTMLRTILDGDERGQPVCFIDLDRLKVVNDGLGHEAGDHVIREAANRLGAAMSGVGVVGRFGGDEFVAIGVSAELDHASMAQRCLDAFAEPVFVAGRTWQLSASVGVVKIDAQRTPGEVLRDADAAMYEAKRAGRGRWRLFESSTREGVVRRMHLEQQLRPALEGGHLTAFFQPMVRASNWQLCGIETLARWHEGEGVWVPPDEFIPLAEELGLIDRLGEQMIDEALAAVDAVNEATAKMCHASVNVSPMQLQSEQLFEKLVSERADGRPTGQLCLEMTEQHIIDDTDRTLMQLQRLLDAGVGLAVDDFGTGYSSLAALHRLPATMLKIDRALVNRLADPAGEAVVAAAIGVAQAYGMETVAEGVETTAQALRLCELGVDHLQGYLFARPEPLDALVERLAGDAWCWDVDETELSAQRSLPLPT